MTINSMSMGVPLTMLPLVLATACAGSAEQNMLVQDERGVESLGQSLLVEFELNEATCTDEEEQRITDGHRLGRIASRSAAFQECLANATVGTIDRHYSNDGVGNMGPYMRCEGDALPSGSDAERHARLMSVSGSPLRTGVQCGDVCDEDQNACATQKSQGERQFINYRNVHQELHDVAPTLWHEVGHNHDYWHDGCSYASASVKTKDHSGNNILGGCIQEVLMQSEVSWVCDWMNCAENEEPMVREYGVYDGGLCECVPDVFANQNEEYDNFGHSLAVGDFNNDTFDDLAVGTPGEGEFRGSVYIFKGTKYGLRFWQRLSQANIQAKDYGVSPPNEFGPAPEEYDDFGYALAAGDLNGDTFPDLVIGSPGEDSHAGAIFIVPGGGAGLRPGAAQYVDQSDGGVAVESGDRFGSALAIGNFDGTGPVDLAVGAPYEIYGGDQTGVVNIFLGKAADVGLGNFITNDGFLHQQLGNTEVNEDDDHFGVALAAGNFDSDASMELAIGAPGDENSAGHVSVANRSSSGWTIPIGLTKSGSKEFGWSLAAANFIGNSGGDLAVGAPSTNQQGAVYLYSGGTSSSPALTYRHALNGDEIGDELGYSLAVGQVIGTSQADLLVGSPGETFSTGLPDGILRVYVGSTTNSIAETLNPNGTLLTFSQGQFFGFGDTDTINPPEVRGRDRFGHAVVLGRFAGNSGTTTAAVGAPNDSGHDVEQTGAVFLSANYVNQAGRKLDQVTMTYERGWRPN